MCAQREAPERSGHQPAALPSGSVGRTPGDQPRPPALGRIPSLLRGLPKDSNARVSKQGREPRGLDPAPRGELTGDPVPWIRTLVTQ